MIFKIHYGLWYGALVGIIPFMFNYAIQYAKATGTQQGVLYTILPFVALLAKPIAGHIADRYAAHRKVLITFISGAMIGYGSLAIYPFFPNLNTNLVFALYCLAALVGNTSMCVVNSIGDSLAVRSAQRKNLTYGTYRAWGPVGFGLFGLVWGFFNEISFLPKFTPGIITLVLIMFMDLIFIASWPDEEEFQVLEQESSPQEPVAAPSGVVHYSSPNKERRSPSPPPPPLHPDLEAAVSPDEARLPELEPMTNGESTTSTSEAHHRDDSPGPRATVRELPQLGRTDLLIKLVREHPSIVVYFFIFTFCGVLTGIHWTYFFQFLQNSTGDKFTLFTTFVLPVQALGGELAFFMVSGYILKKLGALATLTISLVSFATRYLLYAYVINDKTAYFIFPMELLQGPAFGLMYCVLTHQANYFSGKVDKIVARHSNPGDVALRNSLHTTLQGILCAAFEGLGLGLGALIGGSLYDVGPEIMWKVAGFSALAVTLLSTIAVGYQKLQQQRGDRSEPAPAALTHQGPPPSYEAST